MNEELLILDLKQIYNETIWIQTLIRLIAEQDSLIEFDSRQNFIEIIEKIDSFLFSLTDG